MAQVDFSNAQIEPYSKTPMGTYNSGLNATTELYNSSTTVIGSVSITTLKNDTNEAIFQYTGTFSATGTEFLFGYYGSYLCWKVSNVSFNSGDTFSFKIKANVV